MKTLFILLSFIVFLFLFSAPVYASDTFFDPLLVDYLQKLVSSETPQDMVPVLVAFNDKNDIEEVRHTVLKSGGKIKYAYDFINVLAVEISMESINNIKFDKIKGLYLDRKLQLPEPASTNTQKSYPLFENLSNQIVSPSLIWSTGTISAPLVWNKNIDGSGTKIAILDTGIDNTRPSLTGQVIAERDFTLFDEKLDPRDYHGHGTHVAGTAAGLGIDTQLNINTDQAGTYLTLPSEFKNLPSPWVNDAPFNVQYHIGSKEWKALNTSIYAIVTKSAARVDNLKITDAFTDFPSEWNITHNDTYLEIIQPDGHILQIDGDLNQISSLKIDDTTYKHSSSDLDKIVIDNSGTTAATLRFTDYRGNEKTITYAYTSSAGFNPSLNWTSTKQFHVKEGDTVRKFDYVLFTPTQGSEFSHVMQYSAAYNLGSPNGYIELTDIFTGNIERVYLLPGSYTNATFYIDGYAYHVNIIDTFVQTVEFTWGTNANVGSAGDATTIYPLIKAKNGEWITLTTTIKLTHGEAYELPTSNGTGTTYWYDASTHFNSLINIGRLHYKITNGEITVANTLGTGIQYPAVLVVEAKGKNTGNNEVQDAIIIGMDDGPSSGVDLTIKAPILTASTIYSAAETTDNSVTWYYDRYGTMVRYDSDGQGLVEISYPDEQIRAGVIIKSGNESASLETGETKIYLADALTKTGLKTTLSVVDLPHTLASGTFYDDYGMTYNYDQYISPSAGTVTFGNSAGDLKDPALYIDTGSSTAAPLFHYFVTFDKPLNVSSSDVIGNTIDLLGDRYTIGSGSSFDGTVNKLILYGTSNSQLLSEGEEQSIILNDVEHTVQLLAVSSSTVAVLSVDGVIKEVAQGCSYTIKGVDIYVDSVYYYPIGTQTNQARITFSPQRIILEHGQAVKTGTSEDTIEGTLVTLTGTANTGISKITVAVTAKDQSKDYILIGDSFKDPVFGKIEVVFNGFPASETETTTWGDAKVLYKLGTNGVVKIVTTGDYNVVYIDFDRDFSNSYVATEGNYYMYGDWPTQIVNSYIDPNGNSITLGIDLNGDKKIDSLFAGVAPGAKILNGKVCGDIGCYESDIIAGIEWAILSGADIISMSLGGWRNICDGSDPLSMSVDQAWEMGATVVVAAGNSGYFGSETVGSPACAKKAIAVGASSKYPWSVTIADFSSRGPTSDGRIKPEILAPGVKICAPLVPESSLYNYIKDNGLEQSYLICGIEGYLALSGTSMATPHVAGAAALLKQANSSLTPDAIKNLLMNGATDIRESVFSQGSGLINISKSYDILVGSSPLIEPSEINAIVENKAMETVYLNASPYYSMNSSITLDSIETETESFAGFVLQSYGRDETLGFEYTFTIPDNAELFKVYIEWEDLVDSDNNRSENDIDMYVVNPEGYKIAWSTGVLNYESVTVNDPAPGVWKVVVYPWWTSVTKMVNGTLSISKPASWDWVSFDESNNQITIQPNVSNSGLYSGKLMLTHTAGSTLLPLSLIVSQPINFSTAAYHKFSENPCKTKTNESGQTPSSGSSSGGGGGAASPSLGVHSLYGSFDGYLCNSLERKAYSFYLPNSVPSFNLFISWVTEDSDDEFWSDIRAFIYSPNGDVYTSDIYGKMESISINEPIQGKWTVVIESEFAPENGIRYSGDVSYTIVRVSPDYQQLSLKPKENILTAINITNFLEGMDLQVVTEKDVWSGHRINVIPDMVIDESQELGPFLDSYRYYRFNITEIMLSNNDMLQTSLTIQNPYSGSFALYIFDANGTQVSRKYAWGGYDYLSTSYEPGEWTVVVTGQGLFYNQIPFDLQVSILTKSEWNWSTVTPGSSGFFSDKQEFQVNITAPDVEYGVYYAGVYLSGAWYEKIDSTHTVYQGLYPRLVPFIITVSSPPEIEAFYPIDSTYVYGSESENFTIFYTEGDLEKIEIFWKKSTDVFFKRAEIEGCSSGTSQSCTKKINLSMYDDGDNIVYYFEITDKSGITITSSISSVTVDKSLSPGPYNLIIEDIVSVKTAAVADGSDYWEYQFKVTVLGANALRMKLSDWTSGPNIIPVEGYTILRYSSADGEKTYNVMNAYNESEVVYALYDEEPSREGVQATLSLITTIADGSLPGSYKATYGIGLYNV